MDAVLAKLGKKLGRKPMLKRKGLTDSSPMKESGMTVVIGMGKPMRERGAMAKRDDKGYPLDDQGDEPIKETSPEGLSAKLDAVMERLEAIEAKMGMNDDEDEEDDEEDNEDNMEEEN